MFVSFCSTLTPTSLLEAWRGMPKFMALTDTNFPLWVQLGP